MQFAVPSRLEETALLESIACNTASAFFKISSSFALSPPQADAVESKSKDASDQERAVLIILMGIGVSLKLCILAELSSDQTSADAIIVPNLPNTIHQYFARAPVHAFRWRQPGFDLTSATPPSHSQ